MRLNFDAGELHDCFELWRLTLTARIREDGVHGPGPDRLAALAKLDAAIDAWSDLLRHGTPESASAISRACNRPWLASRSGLTRPSWR